MDFSFLKRNFHTEAHLNKPPIRGVRIVIYLLLMNHLFCNSVLSSGQECLKVPALGDGSSASLSKGFRAKLAQKDIKNLAIALINYKPIDTPEKVGRGSAVEAKQLHNIQTA